MKKFLVMLLCLTLCCGSIVGCGDKNKEKNDSKEDDKMESNASETTDPYVLMKRQIEDGMKSYLNVTPTVKQMPAYNPKSSASGANEWSNITAITFDGVEINGAKTKVFAYIGYPENAGESNKAPAMVLVHGGGGHAYADWVKKWTKLGYVAIAFDNTGYFPSAEGKALAGREEDPQTYWNYGLAGDFAEEGYTNAPKDSSMNDVGLPVKEQWMYNAVAQTILAHNILRADKKVDSSKIGITGVSWGGVITSITLGYDDRWAFAMPIYGSGYLDESLAYIGISFMSPESKALWLAQDSFDKIKCPVLWMGWNTDVAFSYNSNSKSYLDTKKNDKTILAMINGLGHGHRAAWNNPTTYRYANWIVKDGGGFAQLEAEPQGREISVKFKKPTDATKVTAKMFYITEKMSYTISGAISSNMDQNWKLEPCIIADDTVTATVPNDAYSYYLELTVTTPEGSYVTTSSLVTP